MVVVKFIIGSDVRRRTVSDVSYESLEQIARDLMNDQNVRLRYKDDEHDLVTIESDVEVAEALSLLEDQLTTSAQSTGSSSTPSLRLFVDVVEGDDSASVRRVPIAASHDDAVHPDDEDLANHEEPQSTPIIEDTQSEDQSTPTAAPSSGHSDFAEDAALVAEQVAETLSSGIEHVLSEMQEHMQGQQQQQQQQQEHAQQRDDASSTPLERFFTSLVSMAREASEHASEAARDANESVSDSIAELDASCRQAVERAVKSGWIKRARESELRHDLAAASLQVRQAFCSLVDRLSERLAAAHEQHQQQTALSRARHWAICDGCQEGITGVRYKCGNCVDYDLCERCEAANNRAGQVGHVHDETHLFVKIRQPLRPGTQGRVRLLSHNMYVQPRHPFARPSAFVTRMARHHGAHAARFRQPVQAQQPQQQPQQPQVSPRMALLQQLRQQRRCPAVEAQSQPPQQLQLPFVCGKPMPHHRPAPSQQPQQQQQQDNGGGESTSVISRRQLGARFVQDVTISDGSVVAPNDEFVKIWRIRNSGSCAFPPNCRLVQVGGDCLAVEPHSQVLPQLEVGEELDVAITMRAPAANGRYISYWRLADSQQKRFGHRLWCDVQVFREVPASEEEQVRQAVELSLKKEDEDNDDDETTTSMQVTYVEEDSDDQSDEVSLSSQSDSSDEEDDETSDDDSADNDGLDDFNVVGGDDDADDADDDDEQNESTLVDRSQASVNAARLVYDSQLQQLEAMGFTDEQMNLELLVREQGNLLRVVSALLQQA